MMAWLLWILGCGMSECRDLCAREADCVEQQLADFSSDWPEWTGFDSREDFEQVCLEVFEDSRDLGASRRDMQRTCKAELERACE